MAQLDPTTDANAEPLMGVAELADYLGIPTASIYVWSKKRKLPPAYRLGKYLKFRRADVDVWLENERRAEK